MGDLISSYVSSVLCQWEQYILRTLNVSVVGTHYKICITKQGKDIILKSEKNAITLSFNTISTVPFRYTGEKNSDWKFVVTACYITEIFE
jgi:hypothetical protein